jgi:predicted outer membrane repeat protein
MCLHTRITGAFNGFEYSSTVIQGCIFMNNTSPDGAGVSSKGLLSITDCSFNHNTAKSRGAAVNVGSQSNVTIVNTEFLGNTATSGAGVYTTGNLTVTQCSFDDHTVSVSGAAIYSAQGSITSFDSSLGLLERRI